MYQKVQSSRLGISFSDLLHGDIVTNKELGMVVFPALRRLGQEDCKFKASLSYHERPENSNANEHFKELK